MVTVCKKMKTQNLMSQEIRIVHEKNLKIECFNRNREHQNKSIFILSGFVLRWTGNIVSRRPCIPLDSLCLGPSCTVLTSTSSEQSST